MTSTYSLVRMIVLLTGENEFAILQEQRRLTDQYLSLHDGLGLEKLDTEDLESSRLRDAILQLPFLASKKLVIIRGVFASKDVTNLLTELLPIIPDTTDLVLVDPKADKRTKLYKDLLSAGCVNQYTDLSDSALIKWLIDYAKDKGSSLSLNDAMQLTIRVGHDQMILAREVEKLAYRATISAQDILELTDQSLGQGIFDLLDKTFSGQKEEALKIYDGLIANKTDPGEILSLIGWQLHTLALVKFAGTGTSAEVAKRTNLHPFVVGKAQKIIRVLSAAQLKRAVASALAVDINIKTASVDAADAVKVLILELTSL